MAEATADLVCNRLDVAAACETAERRLPGVDSPATLERYIEAYDVRGKTGKTNDRSVDGEGTDDR